MEMTEVRSESKLSRPLGLLETMYHVYYTRGVDVYSQMAVLISSSPVSDDDVFSALTCLARKHPLLRMTIREDTNNSVLDGRYYFQEMSNFSVSVSEVTGEDDDMILKDEIKIPFPKDGPLWRFTRIHRATDIFDGNSFPPYELRFMFCCHHGIIDGVYLGILFADFIEFLDMIQCNLLENHDVKEVKMLPAIEQLVALNIVSTKNRKVPGIMHTSSEDHSFVMEALSAYEISFAKDISLLSSTKQVTQLDRFRTPLFESMHFKSECKRRRCTVTGAVLAAASRAFGLLVKPYMDNDVQVIDVPVEVMVNLRRYVPSTFESYPGVAAIHVPITVRVPINENLHSRSLFWYLARQCSDELRNIIASYEPVRLLARETREEINAQKMPGKSNYVICLTNLSSVDNIVKPEQSQRFSLADFPGYTNLALDDMPIFYIAVFSIRNDFHLDIAHCGGYTSQHTAAMFCKEVVHPINGKSKL